MHRDPSLRESASYAIFGSRTARLRLPSSSDRSRYTATRNLPSDNPVRAVKIMEETLCPPPKRNPRQPLRLFSRTSKPALCYTVYWEANYDKYTELRLIDNSLAAIQSNHLQTLIVGRADYPRRTHVLINVVSPSTRRVSITPEPYYKLMLWHLSTEDASYSPNDRYRRKIPTTAESLRRQDLRRLDLPQLLKISILSGNKHIGDSNTLHRLWRTGPSMFPTSDFSNSIHARIHDIEFYIRLNQYTYPPKPDAAKRVQRHKRITRRKVLLGEHLLALTECLPSLNEFIHESMDASLTNNFDRSLFGLPSLNSNLLVGFRPKKHQHEWCAAYTGDPTTLPGDLIGYTIEIQPSYPNPPWIAPVLSVIAHPRGMTSTLTSMNTSVVRQTD